LQSDLQGVVDVLGEQVADEDGQDLDGAARQVFRRRQNLASFESHLRQLKQVDGDLFALQFKLLKNCVTSLRILIGE
jgi:hypothetical protein